MYTFVYHIRVTACKVPTDRPESDGTLEWDATTIVVVRLSAGNTTGVGYTYSAAATGHLILEKLADVVLGRDATDVEGAWFAMRSACRNLGQPGLVMMAVSAVDTALWDLKARLLGVSLLTLLGRYREAVPVYGSGGFTSYSNDQLREQLVGWVERGIGRVKMKVGRDSEADVDRVTAARRAIGAKTGLMVDANGAYDRKQALAKANAFAEQGVSWFEEPVSSEDLEGLRLIRDRAPTGMEVTAGEYGFEPAYFRRLIDAQAVDVPQADATRCGGFTGFRHVGSLCTAAQLPLSAHTAPSLHAFAGCAAPAVRDLEFFHDHVRLESMLFDGVLEPVDGALRPDVSRPGNGLAFKDADAKPFTVLDDTLAVSQSHQR